MSMPLTQTRSVWFVCAATLSLAFLPTVVRADQLMEVSSAENVKGALVTVTDLDGWTLEAVGVGQERSLNGAGGDTYDFEALHRGARLGYAPFSWLQLQLELGGAKPQIAGVHGEEGFEYVGCARVGLLKYVLESSILYGNQHSVSLQSEVSYSHAHAQLTDLDFEWSEFMLVPYVAYAVDYRGSDNWNGYDPRSADLKAGMLFSSVDGRWGGDDLSEGRDFGWMAGGDVQLASDVVFGVTAYVLHSDEVTMELSLGYRF